MSAATSLASWRWYSVVLSAPRQSAAAPPRPKVQAPLPKVLKKFSRLALATFRLPPTAGAPVGRGFAPRNVAVPPSAFTGRSRKALPLAALPENVYVSTPTGSVSVSPPRSVLAADSGDPLRPNTIGSGFWLFRSSSTMTRLRSLAAWSCATRGSPAR